MSSGLGCWNAGSADGERKSPVVFFAAGPANPNGNGVFGLERLPLRCERTYPAV